MNIKSQLIRLTGHIGGHQICRYLSLEIPKILMYHRFSEKPKFGFVDSKAFEKQIVYIKNNFNTSTLENLINSYTSKGKYPDNTVVITIDDGYIDFYNIAFPILKKHDVPATFFVTTRFIDGDFWLWPDRISYILNNSNEIDMPDLPNDLYYTSINITPRDRKKIWRMVIPYLLSVPEKEKNHWISEFAKIQNIKFPIKPVEEYRAVNWNQARELLDNNIEIGAHTQTHPSLTKLDDDILFDEISGSIEVIKNKIGHRPNSFCFPNGQPLDYNERVKQLVKSAGCTSAVTAFYDNKIINDIFEIRRFNVGASWNYFLRAVNGIDVLAAQYFNKNNYI